MNPAMVYSRTGAKLTESFEGLRLNAYYDLRGVLTIGYGHTGPDVTPGMTITADQAEGMLMEDIQFASHCVNTGVDIELTQPEFDALVDFVFNVGCKAFCNSTLRRLLNEGNMQAAATQFDEWDHAGGQVVAGLLRRRQTETQEFNDGA